MDPSEIRASGGLGRLRALFEPSSDSFDEQSNLSGSSSSSKSYGSLSNDIQSLVDEGSITLEDAYQLMKSV